jgi:glycosyltransferase involved in cell wall biosynthesis
MAILTVVIITFNEQRHIARCITALAPLDAEIVVVDSFSTDRTAEIAEALGARVISHPFVNYAQQFQWALDFATISTPWVMRLDADEVIEPDLIAEILQKLPALSENVVGINIKRKHIFMGRWIRHGGRFPLVLLRLWRHGKGRIENRWMDEHMVVWGGQTVTFDHCFSDVNLNDLSFFTTKHNAYATREAIDVLNEKYRLFESDHDLNSKSSSSQAARKRHFKERVYNRMPFWLGPTVYFLYRYTIQLGFLDGVEGAIYHFLQGFWYRFLVGAKIVEFDRLLADNPDHGKRLAILEQASGLRLTHQQSAATPSEGSSAESTNLATAGRSYPPSRAAAGRKVLKSSRKANATDSRV